MELSVSRKKDWPACTLVLGGIFLGGLFSLSGCTRAEKESPPPIVRSPNARTIEKQKKAIREENRKTGEEWTKPNKSYTF
ncbi:MAG: hypothetical protein DIKNOCCD_00499 [bacterium]|nr:MAG: hypothetical protein UZ16_OP3001002559 [Candidatus Hinthialibacteria bacterium OLB16]MBV6480791.1 hypothetical protein [bacterium]